MPDKMIGAALGVLLVKGVRFAPTMSSDSLGPPRMPSPGLPSQTSMGPRSRDRWTPAALKEKVAQLDLEFHKAQTAGDGEAAATNILAALLDLLINLADGKGQMGQERKKLEQVREEILRNAPHVARVVRHLGPLELARLRSPMPTPNNPNNLRFRLPPRGASGTGQVTAGSRSERAIGQGDPERRAPRRGHSRPVGGQPAIPGRWRTPACRGCGRASARRSLYPPTGSPSLRGCKPKPPKIPSNLGLRVF